MQRLQSALEFTPEDLAANRQGELSAAQKERFSKVPPIGWRLLSLMGAMALVAALAAAAQSLVAGVLIAILGIGVLILFYTASHGDTPADAHAPVEQVEGAVQLAYDVNPLRNAEPYNIVVGGQRFAIPYVAYEEIEEGSYWRVYHLPPLKQPLSLEPIDPPDDAAYDVPTEALVDAEIVAPEPLLDTDEKRLQDALGLLTGEREAVDDAADHARQTILALGPGAVPYLATRLEHPAVREVAQALGAKALPAWLASLRADDAPHDAMHDLIGQLAGPAQVPTLHNALQDPSEAVRRGAVFGLWGVGGAEAVPLLENALQDNDEGVQRAALRALGDLQAGVEAIATMADHPDQTTRRLALRALHEMDDPRGANYAFTLVESEDEDDRLSAVAALADKHRDHPRANDLLLALLQDEAAAVRQATAQALLDVPRRDDAFLLPWLAAIDEMTLTEEGIQAYQAAVAAIDMPKVGPLLVERLQAQDSDESLARVIVGALGLHGDDAVLDDLVAAARAREGYSAAFYRDVVAAIQRLEDDRAPMRLRDLAEGDHPALAQAAQDALAGG